MPLYRYKAVGADGKPTEGTFKASNREGLLAHLRESSLTPTSIEELATGIEEPKPETTNISFSFGISKKDLTVFTRQLATTLNAGLPLIRIIHVIHSESTNKRLKKVLESLGQKLQKGKSFSQALEDHGEIFDRMYINMVKVGERSGDLPECIARLAQLLEKEMTLRRKVKSTMAYPSFVLVFTMAITYLLVAVMMPMFTPMFRDSGLNLKRDYPLTQFLMDASDIATDPLYMVIALCCGGVLFFLLKLALGSRTGRYAVDSAKLNFPFIRTFFLNVVAARFSRGFSLLLKSGVPLVDAIGLVAQSAGNELVFRRLNQGARNIGEGDGITATLKSTKVFPDMLIQMSAMGEEAGSLPEMMERVADYYDEEVDSSVTSLTALLEPCVMILIGGIVCIFVMGILLPILGVSAGVQEQL